MNTELYNDKNEIELKRRTLIQTTEGYNVADIKEVSIQSRKRGKKAMYGIFVAMYPVNGVINENKKMYPKPLEDVMREYGSFDFIDFVKRTLIGLMNEFGVIEDEKSVNDLITRESGVSERTYKSYMKLLKDNNVIRKINNRMLVVNPYQLYGNVNISGEKLWQLQANWEAEKVMYKWLTVSDMDRLELAVSKAEMDKSWAQDKIKELEEVNKEVADIYDNPIRYIKPIIDFFIYQKDKGNIAENESFNEFMSNDTGSRHFRSWYLKTEQEPEMKYVYKNRRAYADAFIFVSKWYKDLSDEERLHVDEQI